MENELSITKQKIRGVMFKIDSAAYPEIKDTEWNVVSIESKEGAKKVVRKFFCTMKQYRDLILPFWRLEYTRTVTFEVYSSPIFKLPVLFGVSEIEPAIEQLTLFSSR